MRNAMTPIPSRKTQSGSFMLEALISVVIFAMGIIALVGMAAQAVNQVGQSKYRNDASNLAGELIGQMWLAAAKPADFDKGDWEDRVAAGLPEGLTVVTTEVDPNNGNSALVHITITWSDKEDVTHRYTTSSQVTKN